MATAMASRRLLALLLAAGALLSAPSSARDKSEVDLALVLAVDISLSMEPDEQELQRQGFVAAFRSPDVHRAISQGALGRIAVMYLEWAGASYQEIVVPWTVIEHPSDALNFSARLAGIAIHPTEKYTSISGAIDFSIRQFRESGISAGRQAIDISGDGPNNQGRMVSLARDDAVAKGIAINGLPIMLKRPDGIWDIERLDLYFRDCVIGGPGAFVIPVWKPSQFAEAIKAKMIREIADQSQPRVLVQPAQAELLSNCLAGELRIRNRTGR
jgi:hypothetical protein